MSNVDKLMKVISPESIVANHLLALLEWDKDADPEVTKIRRTMVQLAIEKGWIATDEIDDTTLTSGPKKPPKK